MGSHRYGGTLALGLIWLLFPLSQPAMAQGVTLSRTSLSFSSHVVGKSSTQTVILGNSSSPTALSITSIVASGEYSETDDCNGVVAPSSSCTLSVIFRPKATGPITGVVTINDDANNSPQLIHVTGTGVAPLSVSPATLAFATVAVGQTSPAQTLTVTNASSSSLNLGFSAGGDYQAAGSGAVPCAAVLAGKASCTIAVQFVPTVKGVIDGSLTLTQNINSTPLIVPLSGTGTGGSTPALTFSPKSENFGNVAVGKTKSRSVLVTNNGSSKVNISDIAATGGYTAIGNGSSPCGGALDPGSQCTISVSFKPMATGVTVGSVSITNDSSVKMVILDLSGEGILGVGLSPSTLTFPSQQQGTASAPQTVTLTNNMSSTLNIASIAVSGDYSTTNDCGTSVAAAGTCTIAVSFSPIARTGTVPGTLTVVSGAKSSPQVVELSGRSTGSLPRFAYATNAGDGTISMYTADIHTGQLRSNGYVLSGTRPVAVAVTPSNKFAYVVDAVDNTISGYAISSTTGQLTPSGPVLATGNIPTALSITPSGAFIYVSNDDGTVSGYSVNSTTGALSKIPGSPFPAGSNPFSVTVSPSGKFAYVVNATDSTVSAYHISASTGALTPISGSPFLTVELPTAIVIDPSGSFAYVTGLGDTIAAYQITSGVLNQVTGSPYPTGGDEPLGITIDRSGQFVFVANGNTSNISVFAVSPGSGALTPVQGSPFLEDGGFPASVTVDATNQFLYGTDEHADSVFTFSIAPASGVLRLVQTAPARISTKYLAVSSGPTPITYVPRFAYVPLNGSTNVAGFAINASSGDLTPTPNSPFPTGDNGTSQVAVAPSGQFVYAINNSSVVAFAISPSTGDLTRIAAYPVAPNYSPTSVAVDPSGRFVYVLWNNLGVCYIFIYAVSPSSGALTVSGYVSAGTNPNPASLVVDPSGRFVYLTNNPGPEDLNYAVSAFGIDPMTGALMPVSGSPFTAGMGTGSVVVDPSGPFVYVASDSGAGASISAYSIDPSTGALTPLLGSPFGIQRGIYPFSVSVDPAGRFLYVADNNSIQELSIYFRTGALMEVADLTATPSESVVLDPSGKFAYVANGPKDTVSGYTVGMYGELSPLSDSPFPTGGDGNQTAIAGVFQ